MGLDYLTICHKLYFKKDFSSIINDNKENEFFLFSLNLIHSSWIWSVYEATD